MTRAKVVDKSLRRSGRPASERIHLFEKRQELMWALSVQGYSQEEIGVVFNVNRSVVNRVIRERPVGYVPKWKKVEEKDA